MNREPAEPLRPEECLAVKALLVPYLDGEVSSAEKRQVDDHVVRCPACARDLEVHGRIGDALTAVCARGRLEPLSGLKIGASSAPNLSDRVRASVQSAARRERRARLFWASSAAAAVLVACGFLSWLGSPSSGPGAELVGERSGSPAEPGEELLGALDVLEALDKDGVEPAPEVAQVLYDALESSDPDIVDFLLPEDVAPERS